MSDESSGPESLAAARRNRVATARLSMPDWVFSATIHLLLVLLLVTSKAGPGGGTTGGSGSNGDGGSGSSEFPGNGWLEAQMGIDPGSSPPDALNLKTIEIAKPLDDPEAAPLETHDDFASTTDSTSIQQVGFDRPKEPLPVITANLASEPEAHSSIAGTGISGRTGSGNGQPQGSGDGGDGSTGTGGDGQGGASLFGIWDSGERIVYVIDRSSSMQHYGKLTAARSELEASLARLDPAIEFQVLLYNQQVQPLNVRGSRGLIRATVTNKNQIIGQARLALPDGGTQHLSALQAALRARPTVVYFLTDAEDPGLTAGQIDSIIRQLAGMTRIHCIQFGEIPGELPTAGNWLQKLAQASGGKYLHVRTDALRSADGESSTTR